MLSSPAPLRRLLLPLWQDKFRNTLKRISDNLSVQRNARDLEIYTKVTEVGGYVEAYFTDYGAGGMGEFQQV